MSCLSVCPSSLPASVARRNSCGDSVARKIAIRVSAVENWSTAAQLFLFTFFFFSYTILTSTERFASALRATETGSIFLTRTIWIGLRIRIRIRIRTNRPAPPLLSDALDLRYSFNFCTYFCALLLCEIWNSCHPPSPFFHLTHIKIDSEVIDAGYLIKIPSSKKYIESRKVV